MITRPLLSMTDYETVCRHANPFLTRYSTKLEMTTESN
jgi:hypothetical protein